MTLSKDQIRDNPWWGSADAIERDTQLEELAGLPLVFEHQIPFDLHKDSVRTIRGPRQVGKTTLLKRMIRLLIQEGVPARSVMYLDVEGANLRTPHDLQESIREFLEWMRSTLPDRRAYIFLDEITGIESWGTAIRVLYGRGDLGNTTVMCTGSHARDVKRGAERAPGRKGRVEAWDWIMMPLSFRDYVLMHDPSLSEKLPTFDPTNPVEAFSIAQELQIHQKVIDPLFERYLSTGGYPHAVTAEVEDQEIPIGVYRLYQEAFRGEIVRGGHREDLFRELVSWLSDRHLGVEFNWSDGSGGTAISSHHTVREYLEDAQAAFMWHILHRVKSLDKPIGAPRSPKKLYPVDPFAWQVLRRWVSGSSNPWRDSIAFLGDRLNRSLLVESTVGDHLARWRGPFTLYHRASQGSEEIDFVSFTDYKRSLVEVKYRTQIKATDKKVLRKYGGGILVTRDDFFLNKDNNVTGIPAPLFLAGLPDSLTLYPSLE